MTSAAFGVGRVEVVHRRDVVPGSVDVREALDAFAAQGADGGPVVVFSRCGPTAAFSRRDTLQPEYAAAAEVARSHGFEPVTRPVGGRLAAYNEGSLVVHCRSGHADPRSTITGRFEVFAEVLSDVLAGLGLVDVRVGRVPGEYCSGEWSVNLAGRYKLAGTGQRVNRRGYLFSVVITVGDVDPVRAVLAEAYDAMGLEFAEETVGAVDRWVPGISVDDVEAALAPALEELFLPHPPRDWPQPAVIMQ
jgi:lipoate-protein ligase A